MQILKMKLIFGLNVASMVKHSKMLAIIIEANMMHDKVVKEMCARISKLKDIKDNGELFREEND